MIAIHDGLRIVAMTMRNDLPPRPIEAKSITAMLISETPQPAPQPVAVESPPPPKPELKPIPKPKVKPKIEPKPTPMPVTEVPSQIAAPAPDPTPPPAAPAIGKPTMDLAAPKNVAHLSCNIAQPEYPAMARRRSETGTATVRLTVGLSGKIENVTLQKSSDSSRLDDAALEAVGGSACSLYKENGEAIRATSTALFVFRLDN
ncbi:Ferric siderophore transport system, periplasmic binding protein TonB [Candidatus Burkholderia brachyanthoides]|nr:Ferric siderophore transport system, periplasmic binding protein TonB [Candidatus Burkholderia brachyanthoides]